MRARIQSTAFALVVFVPVLFSGAACFDYEEKVVFKRDMSGYVDLKYTVPIYNKKDRSILKFLPADRESVIERYGKGVRNFAMRVQAQKDKKSRFKRRALVRFRVPFGGPGDLGAILLGELRITREGENLRLERTFPAARAAGESSGWPSRQIRAAVVESLQKRHLNFYTVFPSEFLVVSNRGILVRDGLRHYRMPLKETMDQDKPTRWSLELIAAPKPVAIP